MTSIATPHVYVECDIPDGMTLGGWRRSHTDHPVDLDSRHHLRHLLHRLSRLI